MAMKGSTNFAGNSGMSYTLQTQMQVHLWLYNNIDGTQHNMQTSRVCISKKSCIFDYEGESSNLLGPSCIISCISYPRNACISYPRNAYDKTKQEEVLLPCLQIKVYPNNVKKKKKRIYWMPRHRVNYQPRTHQSQAFGRSD